MWKNADSESGSATDLAEWLVIRGVPFREAHAIVGAIVRESLAGTATLRELVSQHPRLGPDAAALVSPGVAVTRRTTAGGAGPVPVAVQLQRFSDALDTWSTWVGASS